MLTEITRNQVLKDYKNIIMLGNSEMETLLKWDKVALYVTRTEGWAADVHVVDGTAIVTGDAPFGNISVAPLTIKRYEEYAQDITNSNDRWEDKRDACRSLLVKFVREVTASA